jgi:hypothetical protein
MMSGEVEDGVKVSTVPGWANYRAGSGVVEHGKSVGRNSNREAASAERQVNGPSTYGRDHGCALLAETCGAGHIQKATHDIATADETIRLDGVVPSPLSSDLLAPVGGEDVSSMTETAARGQREDFSNVSGC